VVVIVIVLFDELAETFYSILCHHEVLIIPDHELNLTSLGLTICIKIGEFLGESHSVLCEVDCPGLLTVETKKPENQRVINDVLPIVKNK